MVPCKFSELVYTFATNNAICYTRMTFYLSHVHNGVARKLSPSGH